MLVKDQMTPNPICGHPEMPVIEVQALMQEHNFRHLPILDGERLTGVLSIGDVVNALKQEKEVENRYLRDYIQGAVR